MSRSSEFLGLLFLSPGLLNWRLGQTVFLDLFFFLNLATEAREVPQR